MADEPDSLGTGFKRVLTVASISLGFLFFLAPMIAVVLSPDTEFYVGRRASRARIPIEREYGIAVFLGVIALFIAVIGGGLRFALRRAKSIPADDHSAVRLQPGELVRWRGRPAWRTFRGPRIVGAALALAVPGLLLWWWWTALTAPGDLPSRLFLSSMPLLLLFFSVVPGLVAGSGTIHTWLSDMFGTIAITERRIAWITPFGRMYREIGGAEVVDAYLTSDTGRRGSVTVIKSKQDDVEHVYLDGIPMPQSALAALQPLVARGARATAIET